MHDSLGHLTDISTESLHDIARVNELSLLLSLFLLFLIFLPCFSEHIFLRDRRGFDSVVDFDGVQTQLNLQALICQLQCTSHGHINVVHEIYLDSFNIISHFIFGSPIRHYGASVNVHSSRCLLWPSFPYPFTVWFSLSREKSTAFKRNKRNNILMNNHRYIYKYIFYIYNMGRLR